MKLKTEIHSGLLVFEVAPKRIQQNHFIGNSTGLLLQINVCVFYADGRSMRNRKLDPGHVSSALLAATNHSNTFRFPLLLNATYANSFTTLDILYVVIISHISHQGLQPTSRRDGLGNGKSMCLKGGHRNFFLFSYWSRWA